MSNFTFHYIIHDTISLFLVPNPFSNINTGWPWTLTSIIVSSVSMSLTFSKVTIVNITVGISLRKVLKIIYKKVLFFIMICNCLFYTVSSTQVKSAGNSYYMHFFTYFYIIIFLLIVFSYLCKGISACNRCIWRVRT